MRKLIEGLSLIFEREPESSVCAEHDILYCGENLVRYTPEDKARLKSLGFHEVKDFGRWGYFT
jgi:hypothetical protein